MVVVMTIMGTAWHTLSVLLLPCACANVHNRERLEACKARLVEVSKLSKEIEYDRRFGSMDRCIVPTAATEVHELSSGHVGPRVAEARAAEARVAEARAAEMRASEVRTMRARYEHELAGICARRGNRHWSAH